MTNEVTISSDNTQTLYNCLDRIKQLEDVMKVTRLALLKIIGLTYNINYQSNGWEYGIASDALKAMDELLVNHKL